MKEYQQVTGKLRLLAQGTRPDLSFKALEMSNKNNTATNVDLWKINKVLKKVSSKDTKMFYERFRMKEELQIVGIGDCSFKTDEKAVGGVVLLLVTQDFTRVSPIYWKKKQI